MPAITANRYRLVILLILVIIFWQVFRNWSHTDEIKEEIVIRPVGAPVLAMVFYEALCPDSKHFILRQLQPAFYKAPTLVDFQLVPYGKATTTVNSDGSLSFECQHGQDECNANIYHACTIEAVEEPKVLLDMVACMIKDNMIPKQAMLRCAKENHIDYEPIQKCFDSPHGAELLKLHGQATDALRPKMTFVPTVTLDGSQGRQAAILKNLFAEICKVAAGRGPKPAICQESLS